ncbi:MAG: class I SAM-dependent methyltransferase [Armatimonadetes bacterium]|nr:class I SAM-dependent methyltransferase [Armatimonadota bacterium]
MDLRYGGFLGGSKKTDHYHLGAANTVNTDYGMMPQIFNGRIAESDVLVDVGCGKGRVINWWLSRGLKNKIVGIDLDEEIAAKTRQRLRRHPNVTILSGDALELLPEDGTLFYLYSPFSDAVTRQFKERLWERFQHRGNVTVLYYAPYHLAGFTEDPRWEVEEFRLDMTGMAGNHTEQDGRLAVIRMKNG